MRLSEKTLELSICSQLGSLIGRRVIWFGLTQKQEARAGFDACTRLGARILIFQFKASSELRDNNATRRFKAPHRQMEALRQRARRRREIFYVLPNIGTTEELSRNADLLSQTWALDLHSLPALAAPSNPDGSPRKSGEHHLDLTPPVVMVRSDPVKVEAVGLAELVAQLLGDLDDRSVRSAESILDTWDAERWPFSRKSFAMAIV